MKKTTVMIVDDHEIVRAGIRFWLERETDLTVVAETAFGMDVLQLVSIHNPNVLIISLQLPDKKGHDVIREIRQTGNHIPILAMASNREERARYALMAGANGFLYKGETRARFIDAIHWAALRKEGTWLTSMEIIIQRQMDVVIAEAHLSKTELRILPLLDRDNCEIAEKLFLSVGTVKNGVTRIYCKLRVNTRIAAFNWARTHGIL